MKRGILFGTCTGNTEDIAQKICDRLGWESEVMKDVMDVSASDLADYDFLIIGIPTWHIGEMQDDWHCIHEELDDVNLSGLKVALFGLGDQLGYPDTFLDGMGMLYSKLLERGATGGIGFWETEGFDFDDSKALVDGKFCGLALDEDCQPELSDERIETWCVALEEYLNSSSSEVQVAANG